MDTRNDSKRKAAGVLATVTGLAIAVAALSYSPKVGATGQDVGRSCGNHTLRGDYGLLASTVRQVPLPLGGGSERVTAIATWTFHANGTFTQRTGAALKGEVTGVAPEIGEVAGTYSVNPNCTGTMALFVPNLPFPIEYAFVIVDNARQVNAMILNPGIGTVELIRQ